MTLNLEPHIEERVRGLAAEDHVGEDFLVREALLRRLEDREDYAVGIEALSAMKSAISQEEMERKSHVAG